MLTSYNGTAINYDEIGNPYNWVNGETLTWQNGRQLASMVSGGVQSNYAYNTDGMRISKTYGGEETSFYYEGTKLIKEDRPDGTSLFYHYDQNGQMIGFDLVSYNEIAGNLMVNASTSYLYKRNLQGEIVELYMQGGETVATYHYDPYGAIVSILDKDGNDISDLSIGNNAEHVGNINPIRYKGYYYDSETGLYYLQSRYYDADVGRFINADVIISNIGKTSGYNVYSYGVNNPVNTMDLTGHWPQWISNIGNWINTNIIEPVKNFFSPKPNVYESYYQSGIYNSSSSISVGYYEENIRTQHSSRVNSVSNQIYGGYIKASVVNAQSEIEIGNDQFSIGAKNVTDVLTANVFLGVTYKDSYGFSAKAMASAYSSRQTFTFSLLGWEFEIGATGHVGGIGGEATLSLTPGQECYGKFGLSLGVGVSFLFRATRKS